MTLKLLVRKLHLDKNKFIESTKLREYCKYLNLEYDNAVRYLISNRYLIRILKGIFYNLSVEERKLTRLDINYLEAIAEALKLKGIKNWYFALETSMKLNNLTHEYFTTDYIINDTLFRPKPISIMGHKIKFIKLKKSIFGFGIIRKGMINISENEKTLLDLIYLSRYRGVSKKNIEVKISALLNHCSKNKLLEYSKSYNNKIRRFIKELK